MHGPDGKALENVTVYDVRQVDGPDGGVECKVRKFKLEEYEAIMSDAEASQRHPGSFLVVDAPGCALGIWQYGLHGGELQLQEEYFVEGSVVDGEGEPVPGAEVSLGRFGVSTYLNVHVNRAGDQLPWFRTTTDEQGRYRFRGGIIQGYSFDSGVEVIARVEQDGVLKVGRATCSFAGDIKFFEEARKGARRFEEESVRVLPCDEISGAVVDAVTGLPAVGAKLSVYGLGYESQRLKSHEAATDAEGSFRFSKLRVHFIRIECEGYQSSRLVPVEDWRESGHTELAVAMRPMADAQFTLIDAYAKGAPIVPVSLHYAFEDPAGEGWMLEVSRGCGFGSEVTMEMTETGLIAGQFPVGDLKLSCFMGRRERGDDPYSKAFEKTVEASGDSKFELTLERKPGVLFRVVQPPERPASKPDGSDWERVVVWLSSVRQEGSSSRIARPGFAFCPVNEWGDTVNVRVEVQRSGPNGRLMDEDFTADPKSWPVALDAVALREAEGGE